MTSVLVQTLPLSLFYVFYFILFHDLPLSDIKRCNDEKSGKMLQQCYDLVPIRMTLHILVV